MISSYRGKTWKISFVTYIQQFFLKKNDFGGVQTSSGIKIYENGLVKKVTCNISK